MAWTQGCRLRYRSQHLTASAVVIDMNCRKSAPRICATSVGVVAIVVSALSISGCGQLAARPIELAATTPDLAGDQNPSFALERLTPEPPGLHNVIQISDGLFSGSEPHGPEAFAGLAELGIKTVISVDGAIPNVNAATAHGIRYVHIPIGYDGISKSARAALSSAARECDGPIYVHCHHGKHRGPAAAAVLCIAMKIADSPSVRAILEMAGTGQEYAGLWRDVAAFTPPDDVTNAPELVEGAHVDSLTSAMAGVDRHFDNLKLCRDAHWTTPSEHPDVVASQEALLLREALHEALRTVPENRFDAQFREWLTDAGTTAGQMESALNESNRDAAGDSVRRLERACKQCHQKYRNDHQR